MQTVSYWKLSVSLLPFTHLLLRSVLLLLVSCLKVAADALHVRAESVQGCLFVQEHFLFFLLPE